MNLSIELYQREVGISVRKFQMENGKQTFHVQEFPRIELIRANSIEISMLLDYLERTYGFSVSDVIRTVNG